MNPTDRYIRWTQVGEAEPDPRRWKALVVLGTAFFMVILDSTIVLTAIPSIQEHLGFTTSGVQWVMTTYALAFAGLMLFFGRMADLLGRRRIFTLGTALFVLLSLLCGIAWLPGVLVATRALQGVAAAIMAPSALSIVVATFTDVAERNKALGIWGGLGGVGATAGLLLGGVLTSLLGWQWIFFINVPVGVVIVLLCPVLLRESRATAGHRRFDFGGAITITAAPLTLAYAVIRVPEVGWTDGRMIGLIVLGFALVALFVVIERQVADPLVPLRLFRSRKLVGGNLVMLTVGMAADGMLFPLTLYAQQVLKYSALEFGMMSAVMTGTSILGAFAGQALVTRLGIRPVAIAGTLLIGSGCLLLMSVSADGSFRTDMLWGLLVFGPGMGAAFVASQIAALDSVPEDESGLAAGLVDTLFHMGSALGIAVATAVAVSVTDNLLDSRVPIDPLVAKTEGIQYAFTFAAGFGAAGFVVALLLLGSRLKAKTPEKTDVRLVNGV